MIRYLLLLITLINLGCTKELSKSNLANSQPIIQSFENASSFFNGDPTKNNEMKTNWKLTSVYSSFTNEETAYVKKVNNNDYIYPFLWDKYPNIDREPTDNELGIKIPLINYKAIWLDEVRFTGNQIDILLKIISAEGYQICYVYRSNSKGEIKELFNLTSLGEISLKEDTKRGFAIVNSEPSDNYIQETIYTYSKVKRKIVLSDTEKVPFSSQYMSKEIKALQRQSVEDLEQFIRGAWISVNNEDGTSGMLIYFNSNDREVMFSQNDSIEVFNWKSSAKTLGGIYLTLQNRQIDHIYSNFNLSFEDSNRILLSFTGSFMWEGRYRRMSASEKKRALLKTKAISPSSLKIMGSYKSSNDEEFRFSSDNKVELNSSNLQKQGYYVLYTLNDNDIMEMKFLNDRGLIVERKVYLVESTLTKEANRTIHLLSLTEGELFIAGFKAFENANNYLEKIEIKP